MTPWTTTPQPLALSRASLAPLHLWAGLSAAFAGQFSLSHGCWLVCYPLTGALADWGLSRTALVMAGLGAAAAGAGVVLWERTQSSEDDREPRATP